MIWLACVILCLHGFFGNEKSLLSQRPAPIYYGITACLLWSIVSLQFVAASCLVFSGLLFYIGVTRYEDR